MLLFCSMALITVSYQGGSVVHGAQLAVLEVVAPIERGLSRAWDPIAGAWHWTGRLFTATNENPELRAENAELREQLRIARTQEEDLQRLQRLLNYEERHVFPAGFERVHARVVVRAPGVVERSLVIDRGSNAGISEDDSVMVTGGLLGRVTAVTPNTSTVALILDEAQNVSASVTGSDAWGVLSATSTEGTPSLQLNFVKQAAVVNEGDQVVTSGFSGTLKSIYPRGIPIGSVTSVGNDPADVNKTVQVTPFADFDRIDMVMVLVPRDGADS